MLKKTIMKSHAYTGRRMNIIESSSEYCCREDQRTKKGASGPYEINARPDYPHGEGIESTGKVSSCSMTVK